MKAKKSLGQNFLKSEMALRKIIEAGEIKKDDVIVTLGKNGAKRYCNDNGTCRTETYPNVNEHPVRDLTGAGDTFFAGLVAKFIENNDICDAIIFANKCAAWAVTQKGVAVVDRYKIK